MSNETKTIGQEAAETLHRAVQIKWFGNAADRVRLWLPVLADAYDAVNEGDQRRIVHIPSHIGDAGGKDVEAIELLDNFNHWLGRDIVWDALNFVSPWDED